MLVSVIDLSKPTTEIDIGTARLKIRLNKNPKPNVGFFAFCFRKKGLSIPRGLCGKTKGFNCDKNFGSVVETKYAT